MAHDDRRRNGDSDSQLKKVGAMWKPKPGGKSCGSGNVTIRGFRQRFVVLKNHRKHEGSNEPDWLLMSSNEPEVDSYTAREQPANGRGRGRSDERAGVPYDERDDEREAWRR